jgi:DNA (cytosine-5)-methyltransferase 1
MKRGYKEKKGLKMNYYNDNDPKMTAWLRELIKQNLIPPGDVDERSIEDVTGADLEGYTQCHFFAGIGGWLEALRLAGWPADRPVWTGSCPCQPFSSAGKRQGTKDKRHLWPEFYRLIAECNPPVVFGEQVASPLGRKWLAGVRADLEALGYAVGAADLCAAGVGAPHIRQRLWWVADCAGTGQLRAHQLAVHRENGSGGGAGANDTIQGSENGGMAYAEGQRRNGRQNPAGTAGRCCTQNGSGVAHAEGRRVGIGQKAEREAKSSGVGTDGFWDDAVWISCADGKARRIKPGLEPLVDGLPGRVALLRGAGNAIVPQVAAEFIRAYMDFKSSLN